MKRYKTGRCRGCGAKVMTSGAIADVCSKTECWKKVYPELFKGTEDVEVNEYGEIVSEKDKNKGVKLKPHTFFTF